MTQAFLIQSKTFTLCNVSVAIEFFRISNVLITFEFSNIELFYSICCVNEPLDRNTFEIERQILAIDQDFLSK